MLRAALELLFTLVVILAARAILTSLLKGFTGAAARGLRPDQPDPNQSSAQNQTKGQARTTGDLYKDPVCGTYVPDSTTFRRQSGGQTFYYCSEACREKHSLVAR